MDDGRHRLDAVVGRAHPGVGWFPDSELPPAEEGPVRAADEEWTWYSDGSLKPAEEGPASVGWAIVRGDRDESPPQGQQAYEDADVLSGPLGRVGTDEATINTAEAYAILQAVRATPRAVAKVEIVTDCAPCRTTFERLGELSTRGWMRLPNRWIWRAVWAETARRRKGGQEIAVS